MEHFEAADRDRRAPTRSDTFTGKVWGEVVLNSSAEGVRMNAVMFSPGARTYWHRHSGGQILHIAQGQGYVGTRGGGVIAVSPGDVVWAPAGEVHFHGATESHFLLHHAISLGDIEWLEEVADEEYGNPG